MTVTGSSKKKEWSKKNILRSKNISVRILFLKWLQKLYRKSAARLKIILEAECMGQLQKIEYPQFFKNLISMRTSQGFLR